MVVLLECVMCKVNYEKSDPKLWESVQLADTRLADIQLTDRTIY